MFGRSYRAFPGDTYVADLKKAAKSSRSWVKWLWLGIFLSSVADLYIVWTLICFVTDAYDPDYVIECFMSGKVPTSLLFSKPELTVDGVLIPGAISLLITVALVVSYLFVGHTIGKKAREFKEFRKVSSLLSTMLAAIAEAVVLILIVYFRYRAEMALPDNAQAIAAGDTLVIERAFLTVVVLAITMLLGAFLSMLVAYYEGNCVTEMILRESKAHIYDDARVYRQAYYCYASDADKERGYDKAERAIDEEAIGVAFSLSSLASQLNGIVDPADANEFRSVSKMVAEGGYASVR